MAIIACDLAELVGSAIALIALVGGCFIVELVLLQPDWNAVARGFLPQPSSLLDGKQLYLAAGILGATVMPHNLYLHSSLVQSRRWPDLPIARHWALGYSSWDAVIALSLAFLINASILIVASGSFHGRLPEPVTDLSDAYRLLAPTLGASLASTLFGVALLAAGQSSTLTATMAGQIVLEGFLQIRLPDWQRRILTRGLALIPAMASVILLGDRATTNLLVLSQVVLSLQLPFAVIPLVWFCGSSGLMGELQAPLWLQGVGWSCAAVIVMINLSLLLSILRGAGPARRPAVDCRSRTGPVLASGAHPCARQCRPRSRLRKSWRPSAITRAPNAPDADSLLAADRFQLSPGRGSANGSSPFPSAFLSLEMLGSSGNGSVSWLHLLGSEPIAVGLIQPSDLKIGADQFAVLGGIALPAGQQALEFLPELPQFPDLPIDPLDLAPQLDLDVAAGQLTGIVHGQAALDLLQAEPQGLEAADELQALQALFSKQAVTAFAAADRRQQAQILVVAQGLDRQAAAQRQRPDLHASGRHGLDSPPAGRL